MTKYSKESLEKLLLLIDEICSQEEYLWFKEKLQARLFEVNHLNNPDIVKKLNAIQKYLMIDGVEVIDYSEINNEIVRNQLFRDCIEMSKYRLGKINDTINFDEYCRYAHMQAEEMINYFYNFKFYGNIEYVKEFILKHNPSYKFKDVIGSLSEIPYSTKLSAFIKEYKLEKGSLKSILDFLSNLRNELSHRNSLDIKNEDLILCELKNKNFDVSKPYIDFYNTSKSDLELFKKGRFIFMKRKQDYEDIMMNLNYLKEAINLVLK